MMRTPFLVAKIFAAAILLIGPVSFVSAEVAKDPGEKMEHKMVSGTVEYIGPKVFSLEYAQTADSAKSILLPVDDETRYEHVGGLAELKVGDLVRVRYAQTYKEQGKGGRERGYGVLGLGYPNARRLPIFGSHNYGFLEM